MRSKTLKSIWAVAAGILVIVLLSIGTDAILESFVYRLNQILIIPLIYRTVYAIIGGYVCAMFAPQNPKKHVLILNCIGVVLGLMGVIFGWNLSAHWYPIALVITSAIAVYLGGNLRINKKIIR